MKKMMNIICLLLIMALLLTATACGATQPEPTQAPTEPAPAPVVDAIDDNFRTFIIRSLKQYDTDSYPVGVVGSFGYALRDIFEKVAEEEGIKISGFIKTPIEGLVKYHLDK